MIQFFNPHAEKDDQMIYNGGLPYVHWTEPFSIGVIRYKSIYFVSDSANVTIKIDAKRNPFTGSLIDWNFALYNPGHIDGELYAIDWNYFCDLHAIATDNLRLEGQPVQMDGKDVYAYQLIIMCRSDVEGEFIETFYINNIPYKVGAEFYGENESLRINLANQGTELPTIIGKAIYGSDLYEENVDWVLLNRKFRELLVSHLDVMDNKGSYKSLYNALKWFEYGNLVELREVWKYDTPDGTKYYDCPVQTIINEDVKDRMFNSAKTTYFALRHLKRDIIGHDGNGPVYEGTVFNYDPDSNDNVHGITCKWAEEEMKLKMVLLGNFLETYFMPVHADLIRSVVEDVIDFSLYIGFGAADYVHVGSTMPRVDFSWENNVDRVAIDAKIRGHFKAPEKIVSCRYISPQSGKCEIPEPPDVEFDITFESNEAGTFDFYFDLIGESGKQYNYHTTISVIDDITIDIEYYMALKPTSMSPFNIVKNINSEDFIKILNGDELRFGLYNDKKATQYNDLVMCFNPKIVKYIPMDLGADDEFMDSPNPMEKLLLVKVNGYAPGGNYEFLAVVGDYISNPNNNCSAILDTGLSWAVMYRKGAAEWNPDDFTTPPNLDWSKKVHDTCCVAKIEPHKHVRSCYPIICVPKAYRNLGSSPEEIPITESNDPRWEFVPHSTGVPIDNSYVEKIAINDAQEKLPRGMYKITFECKINGRDYKIVTNPDWILENNMRDNA